MTSRVSQHARPARAGAIRRRSAIEPAFSEINGRTAWRHGRLLQAMNISRDVSSFSTTQVHIDAAAGGCGICNGQGADITQTSGGPFPYRPGGGRLPLKRPEA
jgi:hypothetical protein